MEFINISQQKIILFQLLSNLILKSINKTMAYLLQSQQTRQGKNKIQVFFFKKTILKLHLQNIFITIKQELLSWMRS